MLYDSQHKPVASWVMTSKSVTKGGPNEWIPKAMVKELEEWGYGNQKVIIVSDGEASIKAVKDAMIAIREPETIPEETPVGEHDANLAEGMVRRVREQARTIISQLESGAGGKVRKDADIMQWAIRWAANLITNYQVGEDGKTAFERIKCRKCRSPLAQFGERVMYMQLNDGKDDRSKIERTLMNGIWLGIKGRTGEHIIGTEKELSKRTQ